MKKCLVAYIVILIKSEINNILFFSFYLNFVFWHLSYCAVIKAVFSGRDEIVNENVLQRKRKKKKFRDGHLRREWEHFETNKHLFSDENSLIQSFQKKSFCLLFSLPFVLSSHCHLFCLSVFLFLDN